MPALGERNRTIITVGIAVISLVLGAILITNQNQPEGTSISSTQSPAEDGKANMLAGVKGKENNPSLVKDSSEGSKSKIDLQKQSSITLPKVSETPKLSQTPLSTPQTPNPTPFITKTPSPTPSKTPIPTATPDPSPTISSSPSATVSPSLTPTQQNGDGVIINEIGWMGTDVTQTGQYGEWLELYNRGNTQVSLSDWKVLASGDVLINLSGAINPGQYFLIERVTPSSPDPIIDIQGDIMISFGSGGLNNGGDRLELVDGKGIIVDVIDCSGGWFAGSNVSPKKSMERKGAGLSGNSPESWGDNDGVIRSGVDKNGNPIYGTPGSRNSLEI